MVTQPADWIEVELADEADGNAVDLRAVLEAVIRGMPEDPPVEGPETSPER